MNGEKCKTFPIFLYCRFEFYITLESLRRNHEIMLKHDYHVTKASNIILISIERLNDFIIT